MSHTPTYASLLTRLFSGAPEDRAAVLAHLEASEADRTAAEPEVRTRLRDSFPWLRLVAAEAVFRVYRDTPAATAAVAGVLRSGDPAAVADAADVVRQLDVAAVPLLVLMVRHAPDVFSAQTADFHRWAGDVAVRSGPGGLASWVEMLDADNPDTDTGLLIGLAHAAPAVAYDLHPAESELRAFLARSPAGRHAAAGAALWRATWRVNRDWLAGLDPSDPGLGFVGLRELLLDVLIEHLGRRPDLAGLVRETLSALAETDPEAASRAVARLAKLGSRGWGVMIPMLHPSRPAAYHVQEQIFCQAVARPAILPLVHHHAHGVIAEVAAAGANNALVPHAARILADLGPAAGMAVPELLRLAVRVPSAGAVVAPAVARVAPGFPNVAAAVVRALARLRATRDFGPYHLGGFEPLAALLADLDPDAAPALVERTGVDVRVPDLLLCQPAWKDAPPETRARHAGVLADALSNPSPPVRLRAAELLRHYRPEVPDMWPALVAVLTGNDEPAAVAVLRHFRHLGPVENAVTADLVSLFRETNPAYAARAVVALWQLGRTSAIGPEFLGEIEADPELGWGWAVLRGVVDRVRTAHGLPADPNDLFAADPGAVASRVAALVNAPESGDDAAITGLLPRPGDPTAPGTVDWNGVCQLTNVEGVSGALFALALMCEYGSAGSQTQKIWLIKSQRALTGFGLADSKNCVERVMERLERRGAADRREAVHDFFAHRPELPPQITPLLEHRLAWFRWAGLELAAAWSPCPEELTELLEDRVWDLNPRVRERALRLVRG